MSGLVLFMSRLIVRMSGLFAFMSALLVPLSNFLLSSDSKEAIVCMAALQFVHILHLTLLFNFVSDILSCTLTSYICRIQLHLLNTGGVVVDINFLPLQDEMARGYLVLQY